MDPTTAKFTEIIAPLRLGLAVARGTPGCPESVGALCLCHLEGAADAGSHLSRVPFNPNIDNPNSWLIEFQKKLHVDLSHSKLHCFFGKVGGTCVAWDLVRQKLPKDLGRSPNLTYGRTGLFLVPKSLPSLGVLEGGSPNSHDTGSRLQDRTMVPRLRHLISA